MLLGACWRHSNVKPTSRMSAKTSEIFTALTLPGRTPSEVGRRCDPYPFLRQTKARRPGPRSVRSLDGCGASPPCEAGTLRPGSNSPKPRPSTFFRTRQHHGCRRAIQLRFSLAMGNLPISVLSAFPASRARNRNRARNLSLTITIKTRGGRRDLQRGRSLSARSGPRWRRFQRFSQWA